MKNTIIAFALLTSPEMLHAQTRIYVNEYLNIGVGGRGLAMGGAQVASSGDVNSGYWNPAGLVNIEDDFQVGVMHAEYFAGNAKYDFASVALPTKDKKRAFGLSFLRFATDDIPYTIDYIQPDGSFDESKLKSISAGDYAVLLSYAQKIKLFKNPDRYKVIDANGVGHLVGDKKFKKLKGNDTLHASFSFDPKPYPGKNFLFAEANPDNNQPEHYHPNNLGYIPFTINTDQHSPLMDVTFDGMHILDRDIISAKPFIKVLLRDENKYLALNDTSSMKLFLRMPGEPDNTRNKIAYNGTVCRFVPADMSAGKNEAYIEYKPNFAKDGIYQLYAKGKDESGNTAGADNEYSVSFEVINKSTITNLLNYPNPFSTATAFVFTLTGWQIPSQFKIQILTVTGKVVREITRQELGNIRIGRNVTDYKWDGKDQYGQTLGNGVYLYRVVTAINGENIECRSNSNSDIDKFYKNGYSKMYIMR